MLNKTLKDGTKKTGWAPNRLNLLLILVGFIGLLLIPGLGRRKPIQSCPIAVPQAVIGMTQLTNSYQAYDCVALERADTPETREQGLSGRKYLNDLTGMLFVFEGPQPACMWMKDMVFPLDMLWLNQDDKIIKLETNVQPNSYPQTFCAQNTSFVIELNAGIAQRASLKVGQTLHW